MAKKSFKKGIGSLIQDSFSQQQQDEKQETQKQSEDVQELKKRIASLEKQLKLQAEELWKWRTGELTPEKFRQTLEKHNLQYNPNDNSLNKKEKEG